MAGNTTKISIASNALVLIGHEPISSFEDGTTGAVLASALYDTSYSYLLEKHRWRFATKQAQLAKTTDTPLGYKYNNAFQLPIDILYLQLVHRIRDYEIFDDKLYTNHNEVIIDYTFKPKEDKLPAYFIKMFEFYLASQFAVPITDNSSKAQFYSVAYDDARRKATNLDSSQRPNQPIRSNPYIDIRN